MLWWMHSHTVHPQLTPIERYAMNFLEASLEDVCKEELKQAEVRTPVNPNHQTTATRRTLTRFVCVCRSKWRLLGKVWTKPRRKASSFTRFRTMTKTTSCHHQRLWNPLSLPPLAEDGNPRTRTRWWRPLGPAVGCVGPHRRPSLSPPLSEKCLKDSASVCEDVELPKTLAPC